MRSVDITSGTYFAFGVENNDEDSKFKVGDYVRIRKT